MLAASPVPRLGAGLVGGGSRPAPAVLRALLAVPLTVALLGISVVAASGAGPGLGRAEPAVPLTTVRGITVDTTIAGAVEALLAAAERDGIVLAGTGHRDAARQVELRQAHCGVTDYAIHHAPSSACSPPTARPRTSMHEQGLAIDFADCAHATPCFQWLAAHAGAYGLYNLASEPWHWSTSGR
ncbi:MAG: M15 family metallopeptidase [Actinomycetota bacterium]|nr:M15 family metallopeptidase [Actinomycetota bacterium]